MRRLDDRNACSIVASIDLDQGMAFRLPPLSSLRVFEAAARHNSFRKAAEELNLTASAVSHAIQTLENWLGVELFAREARGLRLTNAGETYAPLVNQALSLLASATDQVPGRRPSGTLALSSAPTFASKILVPRLEKFTALFPDIHLTIDTSTRLVDLALDDFDVAIRYLSIKKPASNWTLLVQETLVPVCSPGMKQRFADSTIVEFLSRNTLIHTTTVSAD
jgi:LysR family transcriptional regulator, glycine cleavage system transcriptional activator